jgi:DNA-binding Lrp family transcriptional regulator
MVPTREADEASSEAWLRLCSIAEVKIEAATTGPTNLLASALFRDTQHLYEYLTGPLAGLPGVRSVQTAPIIRTLKRTGSVH